MSGSAEIIERGELRMLNVSWSREAFVNATRFWVEGSRQFAPWFFLPSVFARPIEAFHELAGHALSQQQELARALQGALPAGSRGDAGDLEPAESPAAPGERAESGAFESLRELERERDHALAARAAAEQALAVARAERDEALRALKAARAEIRKARAEADAAVRARDEPPAKAAGATTRKSAASSPGPRKSRSK